MQNLHIAFFALLKFIAIMKFGVLFSLKNSMLMKEIFQKKVFLLLFYL